MRTIVNGELLPFFKGIKFEEFDLAVFVFYESNGDIEGKIASLIDVLIGYNFLSKKPSIKTMTLLSDFIINYSLYFPENFAFEKILSILIPINIPKIEIEIEKNDDGKFNELQGRLGILKIKNNFNYIELMRNCCKSIYHCDFLMAINFLQTLKCNEQFINSNNKLHIQFFNQAFNHLNVIAKIRNDARLEWEIKILKAIK